MVVRPRQPGEKQLSAPRPAMGRSSRSTRLVVEQAPLLEEGVHAHHGAYVARQVPTTCGNGQVLHGVEPICVDHKVTIVLVRDRGLAAVPVIEELGKGLALDAVDRVEIEPSAVAGQDDGVSLGDQMGARRVLDGVLGSGRAGLGQTLARLGLAHDGAGSVLLSISHFRILVGTGIDGCGVGDVSFGGTPLGGTPLGGTPLGGARFGGSVIGVIALKRVTGDDWRRLQPRGCIFGLAERARAIAHGHVCGKEHRIRGPPYDGRQGSESRVPPGYPPGCARAT